MKKRKNEKQLYTAPQCEVLLVEAESFMKTSVVPNPAASTEEDWDNGQEKGGTELEL
mgnify:CR=1 FL=1